MFWGFFDAFLFQPLNKGKYLSISWFVNCYCLKIAHITRNNSKFTKKLEIFENWTVDGTQYAFHENWFSNKISQSQKVRTTFKQNLTCLFLSVRAKSKKPNLL